MTDAATNAHEYTVSELANSLKRTVEETYARVRVRGELGRVTIAKSGHCYLDVKDDKAVINSIIWKGVMNRLSIRPEEGMEVICEGKLSTFPGRSNYQLIVDTMELAGAGALMALFQKRKAQFQAEGLFDADRKQDLPYLPKTIGVVTSPTGAVIRDIRHRIEDRFPCHVIVWPVLVQGDKAANQIAAAITGFNNLPEDGPVPRPDVLIVARGGGSLEDLWCFNEENVVWAAASSSIPLISAVGHETDWTLIDYASDYRAPTPTGAAEVAVPILSELVDTVDDYGLRARRGLSRTIEQKRLSFTAARLPRLQAVLSSPQQRLDIAVTRLPKPDAIIGNAQRSLHAVRLPDITRILDPKVEHLRAASRGLKPAMRANAGRYRSSLDAISARLRPQTLSRTMTETSRRLEQFASRAQRAQTNRIDRQSARLSRAGQLLEALSYQGVLARGYALVTRGDGTVVREGQSLVTGEAVALTFQDGNREAVIEGEASSPTPSKPKTKSAKKRPQKNKSDQSQMGLF